MKISFSIFNGHFLRELGGVVEKYFLIYNGHISAVCPEKYKNLLFQRKQEVLRSGLY